MSYCLHVTESIPQGFRHLPKQNSLTAEYQGVALTEKRTLRDEPYWVVWLHDSPRTLVKAHLASDTRCPPWGW